LKLMVGFPLALALATAPSISSFARYSLSSPQRFGSWERTTISQPGKAAPAKAVAKRSPHVGRLQMAPAQNNVDCLQVKVGAKALSLLENKNKINRMQTTLNRMHVEIGIQASSLVKHIRVPGTIPSHKSSKHHTASSAPVATPGPADIRHMSFPAFKVLSNDHMKGEKASGRYFNFDVATVERIMGRALAKKGENLTLWHIPSGKIASAVFWRVANGGSVGDGHGRWDDGSKIIQFQVGDELAVLHSQSLALSAPRIV